jgi:hypothetical protein
VGEGEAFPFLEIGKVISAMIRRHFGGDLVIKGSGLHKAIHIWSQGSWNCSCQDILRGNLCQTMRQQELGTSNERYSCLTDLARMGDPRHLQDHFVTFLFSSQEYWQAIGESKTSQIDQTVVSNSLSMSHQSG